MGADAESFPGSDGLEPEPGAQAVVDDLFERMATGCGFQAQPLGNIRIQSQGRPHGEASYIKKT
jgi:hypothetical protein